MFFALDARRRLLQDAVTTFAGTYSPEHLVRSVMATDEAPGGWCELHRIVSGTGTGSAAVDPDLIDRAAVLEVLAGALYPGPYLSASLAAHLVGLTRTDDPARRLLPATAAGDHLAVIARPRPTDTIEVAGGSPELTGTIAIALDATTADTLLVGVGPYAVDGWYEVPAGAPGLERRALPALDQTRRLGELTFAGTPARRLALDIDDRDASAQVALIELALVAVDDAGVARHCLRAGLAYAREREQFGRPIGSFQAVKHLLADAAHEVESAWAAAFEAVWTLEHAPERAQRSAALAAAVAGDAAVHAAELMMQIHGGVGFTWDNPSHLYLKRAKSNRLLWGDTAQHRLRLAQLLGL